MRSEPARSGWVLFAAISLSSIAGASPYTVAKGSTAGFVAKITGSSFEAQGKELTGTVDYDEKSGELKGGEISLSCAALDSGLSMRDKHMREKYLEAEKFPTILFRLKPGKVVSGKEAELDGTFVIRQIEKPAKVKITVAPNGKGYGVRSAFKLNITEYGIPQPKFAVVKMEPEIDVKVDLVLERK